MQLFEQGGKCELKDEVFVLPSYLHKLKDIDIKNNTVPPDLNSKYSVIYLHIPNEISSDNVVNLVHYASNHQTAVQYIFKDDYMEIILSDELEERIKSNIERVTTKK
ncbi:MAG: hypothetical protein ACXW09_02485 [Methylococcaceae bacterium]